MMRATVTFEADEKKVEAWLAEMYDPPDDPPPTPQEWFRVRMKELSDDELVVATSFSPIKITHLEVHDGQAAHT